MNACSCAVLDPRCRIHGWVVSDPAPMIDRDLLVAELRRQVEAADPADDNMPWRRVNLNLADSLMGTDWCAPGTDPAQTPSRRVVTRMVSDADVG